MFATEPVNIAGISVTVAVSNAAETDLGRCFTDD